VTLPKPSATLLTALGTLVVLAGCGSSADPPAQGSVDGPDGSTGVSPDGSSSGGDSCATPGVGCPCSVPGQSLSCGKVVQTDGNYVSCSEGTRTCDDGAWSDCIGQYVTTKALSSGGGLRIQGLNPSSVCVGNPCDPACNAFVDDPSGLDAGKDSGLSITDSGVSLFGSPISTATCTSLQITPNTSPAKDLVVTSMTPSPNTVAFTGAILPPSCYPGTPTFLWSINQYSIAQVSTAGLLTLVVPIAGPITVSAYAGSLTASVITNVTVNVVDTSAAPTGYSNTQFPTSTGTVDNISVLYPYPATVFPLGLPSPLIQWQNNNSPATVASAVKVTLRFPATGTPIFSWAEIEPELQTAPTPTLVGQPRATIPQTVWQDFQQTVVSNSGALGGDASFVIQRYVSGVLRAEVPTTIHFANGQMKGNVFYNSYGTNLVQNFGNTVKGQPFGAATLQVAANGTTPTVVVGYNDPTLSGAGCRVCHNAASGGTLLLSNSYLSQGSTGSGATEATTFTYNPTLGTPALIQGSQSLVGSYGSNIFTYAALSPDGTYLLTSAQPASSNPAAGLYTAAGASIASNIPTALHAATPVFSADAAHVAFNFYSGSASPLSTLSGDGKSMAMMDFVPPKTFSNFRVLSTPTALYSVWPTFLPPGQNGVVFQNEITYNGRDWAGTRSTCDGTGTCNNIGATGDLWWVSTTTPPVATVMANMNGGAYMPRSAAGANYHGTAAQNGTYYEEVYNYEPAALPVTIGGYSWVAFTSRRLYGNVATIDPYWSDPRYQDLSVQPTTKKIWIAAVAPNPTPGTDPSYPAFYLPGQELLAGNSRAYFTLAACEAPGAASAANLCTSSLDCCGGAASPATAVCQLDPPPLANPPTSHCVATSSNSCVADTASCTSDAQCCNFAIGSRCGSGKCNAAPPIDFYATSPFMTSYQAVCATGTLPVWRFFYWQTSTPTGTSITFTAATSTNGTAWGAAVPIGTAAPPPTQTTTWTSGTLTVDQALRANGQFSQTYLQVTGVLNTDSTKTLTPVLTNWQLNYDCVASE
jgi:hypothetical protein